MIVTEGLIRGVIVMVDSKVKGQLNPSLVRGNFKPLPNNLNSLNYLVIYLNVKYQYLLSLARGLVTPHLLIHP